MLLLIVLATLTLAGLRLYGVTSQNFKAVAHVFVGFLLGYVVGNHNWIVITSLVVLSLVEAYAFASKFLPAIAVGNLIKKL